MRGRPRKWLGALSTVVKLPPDAFENDILDYIRFARQHGFPIGPPALTQYCESQRAAGLDLAAIANRMEAMQSLTEANYENALIRHQLKRRITSLRKEKANRGGPKRKTLLSISHLMLWCNATAVDPRDLKYQIVWFVLVATGMRAEEHHTAKIKIVGRSIHVQFNGRKNSLESGAAFIKFDYNLSARIPQYVVEYFQMHQQAPKIGTRKNCASCINSWLMKFLPRANLPVPTFKITSGCTRVRMDNVLRDLVDEGRLSQAHYEHMIGHTLKVSNNYYRR
jgi:hypothetical protein